MTEWKPIETAPKGTEVLVWDGEERFVASSDDGQRWLRKNDDTSDYIEFPTHWTELPEPPKVTE